MFLQSFSPFKKNQPANNLSGIWEETWGTPTDEEKIKSEPDQYKIQQKGNNIYMVCLKKKKYYSFSHIHLTDNNFTFQLTNSLDPEHPLVIAYNLYLDETGNRMEGTALTNKGVEAEIVLKRIN